MNVCEVSNCAWTLNVSHQRIEHLGPPSTKHSAPLVRTPLGIVMLIELCDGHTTDYIVFFFTSSDKNISDSAKSMGYLRNIFGWEFFIAFEKLALILAYNKNGMIAKWSLRSQYHDYPVLYIWVTFKFKPVNSDSLFFLV